MPPVTPPVAPPPAVFTPALSGPQGVQMTIDGQVITAVHEGGTIRFHFADGVQDSPQPPYRYYTAGMYDGAQNVFELQFGSLTYSGSFPDPAQFEEFFALGEREYGQTTTPGLERVAIRYTDADGVLWSTQQGSGAQGSSTFMINDMETGYDDFSIYARVIATFGCTVYGPGGAARQITNGALMLEFRDY